MQSKTMQYGLTLKCINCGCQRKILPGEIPVGNCDCCFRDFGWVVFPESFRLTHKEGDEILKDGDVVTVNTRMPVDSTRRIHEIRRGALVIYSDSLGDK
jgi:hypothetical protein